MKNMKKLVALLLATMMILSLSVSAFAATVNTDESDYDTTDETVFNLVFTPGENEAAQMTMIAYLVPDVEYATSNDIPAYSNQEVVAIDQVGGTEGFGKVPVDVAKLQDENKAIAVAIGGTGINTAAKYLVTYNKAANSITVIWGDIDMDGSVSVSDAGYITDRLIGGKTSFTDVNNNTLVLGTSYNGIIWGDIDMDGSVSVSDAGYITDRLIGGKTSFTDDNNNTFVIGEEANITLE